MVRHGAKPYLECSSNGVKRLSAFFARIKSRGNRSIEDIYQGAKVLPDGSRGHSWRAVKGNTDVVNMEECRVLYSTLWDEYIAENPDLLDMIRKASGLQDKFGQAGHVCQATELWRIRNEVNLFNLF